MKTTTLRPHLAVSASVALIGALALTGCAGSAEGGGSTDGTIAIGQITNHSGALSYYGTDMTRGAEIAIDQINAEGGIDGKKLVSEPYDAQTTPTREITYGTQAASKDFVAILAFSLTANQLKWVPAADSAGLPVITNSVSNVIPAIGPHVYQVSPSDGALIPKFIEKVSSALEVTSVAFIGASDDETAVASCDGYKAAFADLNIPTVADEGYNKSATNFSAQLGIVRNAAPDILVLCPFGQEGGQVLSAARNNGYDGPIMGGSALNSTTVLEQGGANLGQVFVPDFWSAQDDDELNTEFVRAFEDAYDASPSRFAAVGYNAIMLLSEALRQADDPTDREQVQEALSSTSEWQYLGCGFTMEERIPSCDDPVALVSEDGTFVKFE
jgi:branched-chain amino acid transport system substrate-binding protein